MGELKDLREQQRHLVNRVTALGNTLYLAGLGTCSKLGNGSEALYERCLQAGSAACGDDAESKPKLVIAGHGLIASTRKLADDVPARRQQAYERFVAAGKEERGAKADGTNEFVLAGLGAVATLRQEGQKLFDDLVAAGEKQQA